jgi:glucokinase
VLVLAGDIGGTKTAIALVEIGRRRLTIRRVRKYPSADHGSLEEILEDFLSRESRRPRTAGFGVAGPVVQGRAKVTKLPWMIDAQRLAHRTRIREVTLVNDFVAASLGLFYLPPRRVAVLARGEESRGGPIALLGAGTGLGQAALTMVRGTYEPLASEGGHADFGPRTAREDRLVRFLRRKHGRVSRDRLLSGQGLASLYDFLKADGFASESARVARALEKEDRAAVVSRFALSRKDALCEEALRLFVSIYGSEAGNLALQYRATGGVYVVGGIAPKILPALLSGPFLEAFRDKPPLEALLTTVPIKVVLEPRLPLFGAAAAAYRTAMERTRPSSKTTRRLARM